MRPVHVKTRKGTMVDCKPGRPGGRRAGDHRRPGHRGGACPCCPRLCPTRPSVPTARLVSPLIVGKDAETDGIYVYTSFCAVAGGGAVAGYDGYQCMCDMGTLGVVGKTDAEEEMARFPWHVNQYEFSTDSHGAGQWRGAPGHRLGGGQRERRVQLHRGSLDRFHHQSQGPARRWSHPAQQGLRAPGRGEDRHPRAASSPEAATR